MVRVIGILPLVGLLDIIHRPHTAGRAILINPSAPAELMMWRWFPAARSPRAPRSAQAIVPRGLARWESSAGRAILREESRKVRSAIGRRLRNGIKATSSVDVDIFRAD